MFCLRMLLPLLLSAILVAAFSLPALAADPAPGKQVEQTLEADDTKMPYLLYLPENYDETDDALPLVLFLHGRGESYGPLSLVAKWGPPKFAARGDKLPFILVSPQCPGNDSWSRDSQQTLLIKLLDHIEETYRVDKARVYVTGLSMGGYGTWRLTADHPGRFAAAAPICGGGKPEDASKLVKLPIWVFHGDQDTAVPFQRSVEMVEAIRKAGGESIRFTTLENIGHNCWSAAYATPQLYSWMFKHKRKLEE